MFGYKKLKKGIEQKNKYVNFSSIEYNAKFQSSKTKKTLKFSILKDPNIITIIGEYINPHTNEKRIVLIKKMNYNHRKWTIGPITFLNNKKNNTKEIKKELIKYGIKKYSLKKISETYLDAYNTQTNGVFVAKIDVFEKIKTSEYEVDNYNMAGVLNYIGSHPENIDRIGSIFVYMIQRGFIKYQPQGSNYTRLETNERISLPGYKNIHHNIPGHIQKLGHNARRGNQKLELIINNNLEKNLKSVRHTTSDVVTILAIAKKKLNGENQVVIIRQPRVGPKKNTIDLIGGDLPFLSSIINEAKEEMREEAGIQTIKSLKIAGTLLDPNSNRKMHLVLANGVDGKYISLSHEVAEKDIIVEKRPISKLLKIVVNGKNTCNADKILFGLYKSGFLGYNL